MVLQWEQGEATDLIDEQRVASEALHGLKKEVLQLQSLDAGSLRAKSQ